MPAKTLLSIAIAALLTCSGVAADTNSQSPEEVCLQLQTIDVELLVTKELGLDLLNRKEEASRTRETFDACVTAYSETANASLAYPTAIAAILADVEHQKGNWLNRATQLGNRDAMLLYGIVLLETRPEAAFSLIQESVRRDSPAAKVIYSLLHIDGPFVPDDPVGPIRMLEETADGGYAPAMYLLGALIVNGTIPDATVSDAIARLKGAAALGHSGAYELLGAMYLTGEGGADNKTLAIPLLRQAAQTGRVLAMIELYKAYASGTGTEIDMDAALFWRGVAESRGMTDAVLAGTDIRSLTGLFF